jgi:hypothetical protein
MLIEPFRQVLPACGAKFEHMVNQMVLGRNRIEQAWLLKAPDLRGSVSAASRARSGNAGRAQSRAEEHSFGRCGVYASELGMSRWRDFGVATIVLVAAILWPRRRRRTKAVYRKELPRVYELQDLIQNPPPSSAYFRDFEGTLSEWPQKRKQFADIESDLQGLDSEAWSRLKEEAASLLTARNEKRGWQALFTILNQAKAYNYLKRLGCTNVKFIPASRIKGQKTPDLQADLDSVKVLCEVKTIGISEIEATRRHGGGVGESTDRLEEGFFNKLTSDLLRAKSQILAFGADRATRKIAYVVVNFDDRLHEYADRYQIQISQYVAANPVPELEIVFEIKPPFYAAMS